MNLKDLLEFIKKNQALLDDLKSAGGDVISDANALIVQKNFTLAKEFVAALDGKIAVDSGEDRLRGLNAAILELQREQLETDDTLREMAINQELGQLLQMRANVAVAAGFESVVAFTPAERSEIASLLTKAEADIHARQDLRTAIDITVRLIALAAKIGGKAATFGVA